MKALIQLSVVFAGLWFILNETSATHGVQSIGTSREEKLQSLRAQLAAKKKSLDARRLADAKLKAMLEKRLRLKQEEFIRSQIPVALKPELSKPIINEQPETENNIDQLNNKSLKEPLISNNAKAVDRSKIKASAIEEIRKSEELAKEMDKVQLENTSSRDRVLNESTLTDKKDTTINKTSEVSVSDNKELNKTTGEITNISQRTTIKTRSLINNGVNNTFIETTTKYITTSMQILNKNNSDGNQSETFADGVTTVSSLSRDENKTTTDAVQVSTVAVTARPNGINQTTDQENNLTSTLDPLLDQDFSGPLGMAIFEDITLANMDNLQRTTQQTRESTFVNTGITSLPERQSTPRSNWGKLTSFLSDLSSWFT